ncbi:MAG: multicopper oxidase domain-containing protein [Blastocatellia bacterium]
MNQKRRNFLRGAAFLGAGAAATNQATAQQPDHQGHQAPPPKTPARPVAKQGNAKPPAHDHEQMLKEQKEQAAQNTRPPAPVICPDIPHLPFTLDKGVKVFHLTAEVVECEFLPASHMGPARDVKAWGYSGSVPGPTIEINEGDRVRIHFHNKLPEMTTMHWHGLEVPVEMDGTPYISQPPIEPGGSFIYEFTINQHGTFFYHSHSAMQEMMGMIGLFIVHPKVPHTPRVDRDFAYVLQGWAILPNNPIPNTFAMEFNWLTMNGKSAPATTPMIVKQGERVRIRLVNLSMDHHPIHMHGHQFYVTGTEGGRIPEAGWYPGNTVLVGVAQARDIEFEAKYTGDWMIHCHLPHHMMNQMVSMVGPMAMTHGGGSQTGLGIENGMGMLQKGHALSDEFGPGFGRGMGITADENATTHLIGLPAPGAAQDAAIFVCPMHPEVKSDKEGSCPKCRMKLVSKQAAQTIYTCPMHPEVTAGKPGKCPKCEMALVRKTTPAMSEEERKRVPGYPQDMMMIMDDEVARPETYGLAAGWSGSMMGMMSLVRVLPADKFEQIMAMVEKGKTDKPKATPQHEHKHE